METFALYLIKSSVWLTGFSLIYMLFLRNERFFVLNRIYLVSGILVSILFPLFTWHYTVVFPVTPTAEVLEPQVLGVATVNEPFPIQNLLLYFYLTGALFLFFRLIKQTLSVWKVIRNSETHRFNSVKLIRTDRYPASFSFFSFVFVNPSIDETETNEIVNHEQEHIRQQHWMDLLLFEILRTMHWFNPVSWLYGRLIKQNHEYLADERALQRSSNPAIYRAALLNQMFGGPVISLANSFNYSLNKKRFNMMKQKTYSPIRKLKLLLVLPLIVGVFYAFATPEYKFMQAGNSSETVNQAQEGRIVKGKIVNDEGQPLKGANIIISGTTIGTISDASGNFELKMTDESPLVVTYVGYGTRRVKPDFSNEMVIQTGRITIGIDLDGNETTVSDPTFLSNPPLIVVDGKEITKSEMDKIDPDKIESIDVIKNKEFTEKYGEKGKNGVVLITMKKDEQTSQTFKVQSNSPLKFGSADGFGNQPLIFVDGVVAKDQNVNNIPPETIESVSVLKDESATKVYGDKGKNGVILIKTRKGANVAKNTPIDVMVNGYASDQGENTNEKPNSRVKFRNIGTSETGNNPILVLDGVIAEDIMFGEMDTSLIKSVNVIKGEMGTKKYGEKGKNGVIEITTKKGSGPLGMGSKPLVVIDGVIAKDQNVDKIDPNTIESMSVLKGEMASKKYGEKGKNGVIQITLKKENEVFFIVEQMPEFPGGVQTLKAFVAATIKYPAIALEKGIQGKVFVAFVVGKDGSVSNAKIGQSVEPSLDAEALRIVKAMPKWTPGKQRGELVEVRYIVPVEFKLPAK